MKTIKQINALKQVLISLTLLCPLLVQAEVLALVNYESKPG